jgi:hypothetical protein
VKKWFGINKSNKTTLAEIPLGGWLILWPKANGFTISPSTKRKFALFAMFFLINNVFLR